MIENPVIAVSVRMPPIQIGFEIQYRTALMAPQNRPRAMRVQMYGPPSSVNVEPSSEIRSP